MKVCVICKQEEGKYKCPTCLIYYCSINCCKKHREIKCKVIDIETPTQSDDGKSKDFFTEDTISQEKLNKLNTDDGLKNILSNPHLRDILLTMDSVKNPEIIMEKAMLEPIFIEFANACLKIVQPPGT